jgi:protein-S-isoprenylcysteine O-methyltransferase Ste14
MTVEFQFWPTATFLFIILYWCVYLTVFLFRKQPLAQATKREPLSKLGIVLQGASYAVIWAVWRTPFTPIVPMPKPADILLALVTMALCVVSLWILIVAMRALGKQWSYQARLVEGHKLIVGGPYRFVRHPIYLAMLLQVLTNGLTLSHWTALLAGLLVFAAGTAIRIRSEEKLLDEAFGDDFAAYRRHVPAVLPRLF